jgi:hypothetical protein
MKSDGRRLEWIRAGELLGLIGIGGLVVFFVMTSWRKWPDPQVDFGRELYLPWRIANGAVLYRDVDDNYGPLSQYFNAALFKCFGPGLMVLVRANLIIFTVILGTIYCICRKAWGIGAALVSSALFVSVFGFSQLVRCGNYNYATPYSHEATHGLLICLLLVVMLFRFTQRATLGGAFGAGLLFGISAILKAEIMLPAAMITLAAALMQWRNRKPISLRQIGAWAAGAILPTLAFAVYFAMWMPWDQAIGASCAAWLNVTTSTRLATEPQEAAFLGFDEPWSNLWGHLAATVIACGVITMIAGAAWLAERTKDRETQFVIGVLSAASISCLSNWGIHWIECGTCLLGVMLIYLCCSVVPIFSKTASETFDQTRIIRILMAVLATGLLARMILRGRIYQYGFYQAAVAALVIPAILVGELPSRLGMGRCGRLIIALGTVSLLAPGAMIVAGLSQQMLRAKTLAVGDGVDQFYAFPSELVPSGELVRRVSETLRDEAPGHTLLVLPQGVMVNYLVRMPSPISQVYFYAGATSGGREQTIVTALGRHPPDYVAIMSADLSDCGIERYGTEVGNGRLILNWVSENYKQSYSMGGDPLEWQGAGAVILKRKSG